MADYWKSQPKKFCDFCKCWISDNKASRDFHENGKRHQESVKKRLDEIKKKSIEDDKNKKDASGYLEQMERAAMQKLREDLAADPSLASQYGVTIKNKQQEGNPTSSSCSSATSISTSNITSNSTGEWQEAYSPEGYLYYYNSVTNESRWELPADAIKTEEQKLEVKDSTDVKTIKSNQPEPVLGNNKTISAEASSADDTKEKKTGKDIEAVKKPAMKMSAKISKTNVNVNTSDEDADKSQNGIKTENAATFKSPYGAWAEITTEDETPVDYELPCVQQESYNVVSSVEPDVPKIKFAEKTFSSLSDGMSEQSEGFKKRKLNTGGCRNIRRTKDEDS